MTTQIKNDQAINNVLESTQWTDLMVRKALDDNGQVPYSGGTWTNSPDIIPNGTVAVGDPQGTFGTAASFNSNPGQPTVSQQVNYFYVRTKNLAAGAESGTVSLYYCPQNLFLFPSLWSKNQMKTSSGKTSLPLSAAATNAVSVTGEAFTYTPVSDIHSCLIAQVQTQANPNPLPADGTIANMSDLATYICKHPNMGWRNVVLVDHNVPTFINNIAVDTTSLKPGTNATMLIGVSYTNLSIGSQIAFSAGTPIPSGPDQGKLIQLAQTAVNQNSGSLGTSYLTIPAGFQTNVALSYFAQGNVQPGWSLRFYAILVVEPGDAELAAHALPVHELGIDGLDESHPLLKMGTGGITTGIRIGDCVLTGC